MGRKLLMLDKFQKYSKRCRPPSLVSSLSLSPHVARTASRGGGVSASQAGLVSFQMCPCRPLLPALLGAARLCDTPGPPKQ